jgi:uncharacterized protein (TIGR02001 family)
MFKTKLIPAAVAATLLAGGTQAVQADDDGFQFSGNVALVSDYRFRGISQSDEEFAIQGGFDAEFGPGFYIGTWGSSVDFDTNDGADGSLELDYYGGWASTIGDTDFGIDIGYAYYDYPGDDGGFGDYQEFYIGTSWKDLSLQVNYSDDYYAETGDFWYIAGDYSFTLLEDFTIGLHVGYNILEETEYDAAGNVTDGGFLATDEDAYTDYSVTVTYSWAGLDWSLAYVGTDLDEEDVFDTDWADDTAVFSVAKSL